MIARNIFTWIVWSTVLAVFVNGCSYNEKVFRRSQLANPLEAGRISVMTTHKAIYRLENYILKDSTILGAGFLDDGEKRIPYNGEIRFSEIAYVQVQNSSFWRGVAVAVPVVVFAATALTSFGGNNELAVTPVITYHGGGSCPFIYAWNGADYTLEGEAIATAWGKALEVNTRTVLPSLKERDGVLDIRITNERPETHYINDAQLVAAETDAQAIVCVDTHNTLWPVYAPVPPVKATDQLGNNIVAKVHSKDGQYWESDIDASSGEMKLEDVVDVTFLKPAYQGEATLVIDAINTRMFDTVLRTVSDYLGSETLAFMDAIEHDPEMIAILKQWLEESSLKAFLWNGIEWQPIGTVLGEADEVPFSRVIRFNAGCVEGDSVKIRLTCLADVCKLDAVQVDWSSVQPLNAEPVSLISALGPKEKDIAATLAHADDQYVVVLPPEKIELKFQALHPQHGKKLVYALNLQGYLHEWFPEPKNQTTMTMVKYLKGESKIGYLKNLLRHKSVFLPLIYAEWKRTKSGN